MTSCSQVYMLGGTSETKGVAERRNALQSSGSDYHLLPQEFWEVWGVKGHHTALGSMQLRSLDVQHHHFRLGHLLKSIATVPES